MSGLKYSTPSSLYDSSMQKSTPGSSVSKKSLMHAGHSVPSSSQRSIVQEKSSPVNSTPPEFKRVHITPIRMDSINGETSTYDAILKRVSEKVSINEQKTFLKNVGSMFDDDEDHSHHSVSPEVSVTIMDYGIGNPIKEVLPEEKSDNDSPPLNNTDIVDNDTKFQPDDDFPSSSSGGNSNWLNLLATAASLVNDDLQTTATTNNQNLLPKAVCDNEQQFVINAANQRLHLLPAAPIQPTVSFTKLNQTLSLPPNATSNSYIAKDKLDELLPEYQVQIDFLREIDKVFFPTHDDAQRLLQRYLLLSVESVRDVVFAQHDEFVAQGIFTETDV